MLYYAYFMKFLSHPIINTKSDCTTVFILHTIVEISLVILTRFRFQVKAVESLAGIAYINRMYSTHIRWGFVGISWTLSNRLVSRSTGSAARWRTMDSWPNIFLKRIFVLSLTLVLTNARMTRLFIKTIGKHQSPVLLCHQGQLV